MINFKIQFLIFFVLVISFIVYLILLLSAINEYYVSLLTINFIITSFFIHLHSSATLSLFAFNAQSTSLISIIMKL